ncbi:lamin tail domain-containing protein [Halosegnis sp.]|uniref:lamin tail domain-containing protein n=1 Tax=Halosegnis sp. TaxID=2864959 RepID=UPI0035D4AB22
MARFGVVLVLVGLFILAGCSGAVDTAPNDATARASAPPVPTPAATVTVTRAVDGDTLEIRFDNGTTDTVRLIGVDTPEVHAENSPDEFEGVPETAAGRDCLRRWGERASDQAKRLEGETVGIAFDPNLDRRGYYGRLLVYVVEDGVSFNYDLVARGYARMYESPFTRADAYAAAETEAMNAGRGVWECATDSPPTATPTPAAEGGLVVSVHADAAGNDNENLNDEYVTLANRGETSLELDGWTVTDAAGHRYELGTLRLGAGEAVTIHTGTGNDTTSDVYWGRASAVWNNGGDTATVRAANGTVVAEQSY